METFAKMSEEDILLLIKWQWEHQEHGGLGDDVRQDDLHEDGQARGPQSCLQLKKSKVEDI